MFLTTWRKSSFSEAPDGNCVEVAWRKSSFSSAPDGNCVEIAYAPPGVVVRDSKNTNGPTLTIGLEGWCALITDRSGRRSALG
jgi:hypothetical protein